MTGINPATPPKSTLSPTKSGADPLNQFVPSLQLLLLTASAPIQVAPGERILADVPAVVLAKV